MTAALRAGHDLARQRTWACRTTIFETIADFSVVPTAIQTAVTSRSGAELSIDNPDFGINGGAGLWRCDVRRRQRRWWHTILSFGGGNTLFL